MCVCVFLILSFLLDVSSPSSCSYQHRILGRPVFRLSSHSGSFVPLVPLSFYTSVCCVWAAAGPHWALLGGVESQCLGDWAHRPQTFPHNWNGSLLPTSMFPSADRIEFPQRPLFILIPRRDLSWLQRTQLQGTLSHLGNVVKVKNDVPGLNCTLSCSSETATVSCKSADLVAFNFFVSHWSVLLGVGNIVEVP